MPQGIRAELTKEYVQKYINERYELNSASGCWEFIGSKDVWGYGHCRIQYKLYKVHRLSYWAFNNDPAFELGDKDIHICHTCDNPICVNPEHLFAGTHKQNMQDKVKKGRQKKGSKHCDEALAIEVLKMAHRGVTTVAIAQRTGLLPRVVSQIRNKTIYPYLIVLDEGDVLEIFDNRSLHTDAETVSRTTQSPNKKTNNPRRDSRN